MDLEQSLKALHADFDKFYRALRNVIAESPDLIVPMVRPDQDEDFLLSLIIALRLDDRVFDHEGYQRAILPLAAHPHCDIRRYVHETLSNSAREEFYPLIVKYVLGDQKTDCPDHAIHFLRPFIDHHEDEIVEIVSGIVEDGSLITKFYAYQTLVWCEGPRGQHRLKELRNSVTNVKFHLILGEFHKYLRTKKARYEEMKTNPETYQDIFTMRRIVSNFPILPEYLE